MATYYVDGKNGNDAANGSTTNPWKTLNKARAAVAPGDEVRLRTAVYHETLAITVEDTKWLADDNHKPTLDGRFHEGLVQSNGAIPDPWQSGHNYLPAHPHSAMVSLEAANITVDGLTVQNAAGTGIAVSASNCVVRNCRVDFCYRQCLYALTPDSAYVEHPILENNVVTRASVEYLDSIQGGRSREVCASIAVTRTRDAVIRNNVSAYNFGEGISISRGPFRTIVEGNVVHTCKSNQISNERAVDTVIRNNLVFHLQSPSFLLAKTSGVPAGIVLLDEDPGDTRFPRSTGGQIYNNIVIGTGVLLSVYNGSNADTQLNEAYIGFNTFIAGPKTQTGIHITGNTRERPHHNSLFENNIIVGKTQIGFVTGDVSGIVFRNNLWSVQPAAEMRGPGDRIGEAFLANPGAPITGETIPDPRTNIDPRNYNLTDRSTLAIGAASDGSRASDLTPPDIHKDFFGASRNETPNIGAHEYSGAVTKIAANFSIGPAQEMGKAPHTVDFADKSTSARPIATWAWEFGDGSTSADRNPSHTFLRAGVFDVSLTVADDQGNQDTTRFAGLMEVVELAADVPANFRRFAIVNRTSRVAFAFGTQYPDGRCMMLWNERPYFVLSYRNIDEVARHEAQGGRELVWVDPSLSQFESDDALLSDLESQILIEVA